MPEDDPRTTLSRRWQLADGLVVERLDNETVVFDTASRTLHHLDAVATQIWTRLDGTTELTAVVRELAARTETDENQVAADVVRLVQQLDRLRLLTPSPPNQ